MAAMATLPTLDTRRRSEVLGDFTTQAPALLPGRPGWCGSGPQAPPRAAGSGQGRGESSSSSWQAGDAHPLALLHRLDARRSPASSARSTRRPSPSSWPICRTDHGRPDPRPDGRSAAQPTWPPHRHHGSDQPPTSCRTSPTCSSRSRPPLLRAGVARRARSGGVHPDWSPSSTRRDRPSEKQILSELEESDPELAEEIRNELFVFDDVVGLDDRTLQRVLRNVVPKDLAVALKGVERGRCARSSCATCPSGPPRTCARRSSCSARPGCHRSRAAQSAVVKIVRELEAAGEIVLSRGDDEFV